MNHDVRDLNLASEGKRRIEWADRRMPVLERIRADYEREQPFKGIIIAACLHVTTETANLMRTLVAGGADVALCASNPLSTQDEVAASLVNDYGVPVFAIHGEDNDTYYAHIEAVLDRGARITMDDGADLVSTLHSKKADLAAQVIGGTEETTTGVIRLRSMEKNNVLKYPIIAVNDSETKHFFDNRYGTGQSTIDGILRSTNVLLAGENFVICGYGWCGRGLAMRARGMGAHVVVTEINPVKAIEALMDGFRVMPLAEAAPFGDIFVPVTGNKHVIDKEDFALMKDGAIVANSGHFDVEINKDDLAAMCPEHRTVRPGVEEYQRRDGARICLLTEGRLVNLSAAEGHPASVMDMSFANQSLAVKYILEQASNLEKRVYCLPEELDHEIAFLKIETMGVSIDELTEEQKEYLAGWAEGT
jgi:adenosylhomocysteinase